MRELLHEVLTLQPSWTHKNTPEMQQRGILIRQQIPNWLREQAVGLAAALGPSGADLDIEGRDGTGPKSETTGAVGSIILTTNEVAAHRQSHPENALIIVHSIDLDRSKQPPRASGGIIYSIAPWAIDASALQPLSFQYVLRPGGDGGITRVKSSAGPSGS